MTTGGWIFMLITWSVIGGLMAFCYTRVIKSDVDKDVI